MAYKTEEAELVAALGRSWTVEDSKRILTRTQLLFIQNQRNGNYRQILEEQVREHLQDLIGEKKCKDSILQLALHLCGSEEGKLFLRISTNRTHDSDDDDEEANLSTGARILNQLLTRVCDDTAGSEEDELCSICLDRLHQPHEIIATLQNCWHEFHAECIKKWLLQGQNFCPLCKKKTLHR